MVSHQRHEHGLRPPTTSQSAQSPVPPMPLAHLANGMRKPTTVHRLHTRSLYREIGAL